MNILIKPVKKLTSYEKTLMNKIRVREGGKGCKKDFNKDYPSGTVFFFVKERGKILAFGGLEPIKINYLGKDYNILGICNIFSVEKGKGYGSILIKEMIKYLKKKGKTGLGFTGAIKFFKKVGLKTRKDFGKRFALRNPKTGKMRFAKKGDEGDGIYYEGKDRLISKMLKTKSVGYYWLPRLKELHF